jgi:HEAT repeat protein
MVKSLLVVLKDRDPEFRRYLAFLLGEMGDPVAVEPLIDVLQDRDIMIKETAAMSLSQLAGENFGVDQKKWKDWWAANKNRRGIQ